MNSNGNLTRATAPKTFVIFSCVRLTMGWPCSSCGWFWTAIRRRWSVIRGYMGTMIHSLNGISSVARHCRRSTSTRQAQSIKSIPHWTMPLARHTAKCEGNQMRGTRHNWPGSWMIYSIRSHSTLNQSTTPFTRRTSTRAIMRLRDNNNRQRTLTFSFSLRHTRTRNTCPHLARTLPVPTITRPSLIFVVLLIQMTINALNVATRWVGQHTNIRQNWLSCLANSQAPFTAKCDHAWTPQYTHPTTQQHTPSHQRCRACHQEPDRVRHIDNCQAEQGDRGRWGWFDFVGALRARDENAERQTAKTIEPASE